MNLHLYFKNTFFYITVVLYIKMRLSTGVDAPKQDSTKRTLIHYYSLCRLWLNNIEL